MDVEFCIFLHFSTLTTNRTFGFVLKNLIRKNFLPNAVFDFCIAPCTQLFELLFFFLVGCHIDWYEFLPTWWAELKSWCSLWKSMSLPPRCVPGPMQIDLYLRHDNNYHSKKGTSRIYIKYNQFHTFWMFNVSLDQFHTFWGGLLTRNCWKQGA